MLGCGIAMWQIVELFKLVRWWCPLVVLYNKSVADVLVVEFGTYTVDGMGDALVSRVSNHRIFD